MTYLTVITINNVTLSKPISGQIASLPNLQELKLFWVTNLQFAPYPANALSPLTQFAILDADISGPIPDLRPYPNLTRVDIKRTALDGSIPAYLGGLTELTAIVLTENRLTGEIPPELGQLPKLSLLALFKNQLTGTIPLELGLSVSLTNLDVSNNQLTGSIPRQLALKSIASQRYSFNRLTGTIPAEYGSMTSLLYIYLTSNRLTGTIPQGIGNLPNLGIFDASDNPLSGCFNATLAKVFYCDVSLTNLCCTPLNPVCNITGYDCKTTC